MGKLAGDVRGRIGACIALLLICAVPAIATRTRATSVDPTGRIAAGAAFTCAIKNDNTVWCWGRNDQGQLGSSAHIGITESLIPVQAAALGGGRVPSKIVAGAEHACVLATDGTVWCWGRNGSGQLGVSIGNRYDPVQVSLSGTATLLAAGGANTCAVLTNNSVQCWGQNTFGQLGNSSSDANIHDSPVTVSGIPASFTVASLEIGTGHVCAVSTNNDAWCWGRYLYGQLGNSSAANATTPTHTSTLGGLATSVTAGADHTCVVVGTGLMCFGRNNYGQSGQSVATTQFSAPTAVSVTGTVSRVSAGDGHTCLMLSTGGVQCFGRNNYSQLGRSTVGATDPAPGTVNGLPAGAVDVVAGASHTCAMTPTGEVMCWGLNDWGQLGDNSQNDSNSAVAVLYMNALPTTTTSSTAATTTVPLATTTVPLATTTVPLATTTIPLATTTVPLATTTPVATTTTPITTSVTTTPVTSSVTTTSVTSSQLAISSAPKVAILKVRKGKSVTAKKIAATVTLKIPKRSQGTMRISITRGTKYCAFIGSTVRGVRKGSCTVTVVLLPKKGKPTVKTVKISVLS